MEAQKKTQGYGLCLKWGLRIIGLLDFVALLSEEDAAVNQDLIVQGFAKEANERQFAPFLHPK